MSNATVTLINNGTRGLGFPSVKLGEDDTVQGFLLPAGERTTVPEAYVDALTAATRSRRSKKRPGREKYAGILARIDRGQIVIKRGAVPAPAAPKPAGGARETLEGLSVPDAGPLIAEEDNLDVLARWREADERVTIHRLIDDRLEELAETEE